MFCVRCLSYVGCLLLFDVSVFFVSLSFVICWLLDVVCCLLSVVWCSMLFVARGLLFVDVVCCWLCLFDVYCSLFVC